MCVIIILLLEPASALFYPKACDYRTLGFDLR